MKTASDDLHALIHVLNTSEKGYFKKFAKRHADKENDYLQLFNEIEKQPVYNERALKHIKDLPGKKHRLYEQILNSLLVYSSGSGSINFTLDKTILQVKILAYRRLFSQALKLTRKSIELAEKNESYDQAGFLAGMEIDLLMRTVTENEIWDIATTRYKRMTDFYKKSMNVDRILSEQKKVGFALDLKKRGKPYKEHLKQIDIDFLKDKSNALTERAEIFRLAVLFMYYDLTDDITRHLLYARESMKLNEKLHKKYFPARSHIYMSALYDYGSIMAANGNWKEVKQAWNKLEKLKIDSFAWSYKRDVVATVLAQMYLWNDANFEKAVTLTQSLLQRQKSAISDYDIAFGLRLKTNLALLYFATGQHQQSYLLVQDIYAHSKARQDIETCRQADLLNLLIQVELRNYTLLNGLVKAFRKRYLKKSSQSDMFLIDFTNALLKYPKINGQAFSALLAGEDDLLLFERLHISHWIKSKALHKPLAEIIRGR